MYIMVELFLRLKKLTSYSLIYLNTLPTLKKFCHNMITCIDTEEYETGIADDMASFVMDINSLNKGPSSSLTSILRRVG